jgi:hypothetical protein
VDHIFQLIISKETTTFAVVFQKSFLINYSCISVWLNNFNDIVRQPKNLYTSTDFNTFYVLVHAATYMKDKS